MKVFLGGTCNGSTWRDDLIPMLRVDYFNPVVEDWTPECQAREVQERENADFAIYTITPKMIGVYAVAEAVDDSNKRPEKTVFCLLTTDGENAFTAGQLRSLDAVGKMITRNGGHWFSTLENVANLVNGLAAQTTKGII